MKKILYGIIVGFIILIILINVFSSFNLSFFGFRVFKVASGSMSPYISVNDLIVVKKLNNYQVGDVITFEDTGFITHRIVKIEDNKIITKGDNNNLDDDPIEKNKIIGKIIFRIKKFYLLLYPFFIILLLSILIIIPNRQKIERRKKNEINKKI